MPLMGVYYNHRRVSLEELYEKAKAKSAMDAKALEELQLIFVFLFSLLCVVFPQNRPYCCDKGLYADTLHFTYHFIKIRLFSQSFKK